VTNAGRTFLIIGASRGIGRAVCEHLLGQGHCVIGVSRSQARCDEWVRADVSTPEGIRTVIDHVGSRRLDGLLFLGGVWEMNAFTGHYSFEASSDAETRLVIAVNLIAPIELSRGLSKNLAASLNPRCIFIGSLSGLDNLASAEVANTASKFGLRGAVQALRLALRGHRIGFSVVNPGNVATDEVLSDIAAGRFPEQQPIPLGDLCRTIDWLLDLSPDTEVGEVSLMQRPRL
jgi:NAD(P)-dependent dehydrogenase (short-subunit alcohol dehydrogenase family)